MTIPVTGHQLVVGGTGMLADLTLRLARDSEHVTVVGRSQTRLERIRDAALPHRVNSVAADYCDLELFLTHLRQARQAFGPFTRAITWIHSVAPDATRRIEEFLAEDPPADIYEIRGSAAADPSRSPGMRRSETPGVNRHTIILGFQIEGTHSRWLTHDEICDGVYDAIVHGRKRSIVGVVEPWDRRP